MHKLMRIIFAAVAIFLAGICNAAQDCSDIDAQAAGSAKGSMKTWSDIYSGFQHYGHCDDGGIAEGFSEAVVHLMASQWDSLPQAATLAKKDPSFRVFLLIHIDATADTNELRKIEKFSQFQCAAQLREFCTAIQASAKQAVSESP
jgi:hypothetical protein